ncbi:MAG TPA: AAA family ATPase, partial [Chitinophagales bacterium]|nr:AAA family ATPase [Chitinophagales bacterium]
MVISDFRIAQLVLTNYKNYTFQRFEFGTKLNFIVGNNGTGKTSLLDAIYYTCFTKSYLSSSDILNVRFTTEFFRIETHLDVNNTPHLVEVKYSKNEKKEILLDKSKLEKLADYIGKFPCVIITPDDSQLILGSSELRRKFLDASLSQYSSEYFQQLLLYNKILAQRNALLKSFYENRFFDKNLLDVYN